MTRYFPIAGWLRAYRSEWLRFDVIAGVTTAAVVIPKAMAMATIAGLSVEFGLYTALLPMVIYAVLGTSRRLSMSTTSTIAILTGAALTEVIHAGTPDQMMAATATLTVMVGIGSAAGVDPETGRDRQFHFGPGPDGLQDRAGNGDCGRSSAEAARDPH